MKLINKDILELLMSGDFNHLTIGEFIEIIKRVENETVKRDR